MAVATLGITTSFSITPAAVAVCATNLSRRGILITNIGAGTVYVGFGTGNAATTGMHPIASTTGSLSIEYGRLNNNGTNSIPAAVPTGDVSLICLTTTSVCCVTEW